MNEKMTTVEPPDYYGEAFKATIKAKMPLPELTAALCAGLAEAMDDFLKKVEDND